MKHTHFWLILFCVLSLSLLFCACGGSDAQYTNTDTFTVTFDSNGGSTVESMAVGFASKISAPEVTREGYTLVAWNYEGKPWDFGSYSVTKDITLTAEWEPGAYTVTFNLNGGTNGAGNPASYNIETPAFTLAEPSKENYIFVGWTYEGQTTPTKSVTVEKGSMGDKVFTANWTPVSYTISYNLNGGTNATGNPKSYNIETAIATLAEPTRTGYTFVGWTYEGQTTPTKSVTVEKGSTGDKVFTANWTAVGYSITYNLNGGTNAVSNPTTYNVESPTFTLAEPSRVGYAFTGWTYEGQSTPTKPVTVAKGSNGNKVFTANWALVSYTITYNLDGGTNAVSNPTTYNVETATFTLAEPTRTGYAFVGWTYNGQSTPTKSVTVAKGSTGNKAFTANLEAIFTYSAGGKTVTGLTELGKALSQITIPDSVTSIGESAFFGCSGLTSITIPSGVTSIGSSAFSGCTGLTSITIPSSVTSIGSSAFSGCTGLTSITIPSSVTSIGGYAFFGCTGLTSITIPSSVTSIGDYAFYNCSGLTSITFQGTIAQWNAITKGSRWSDNTGTYTIYCTDGNIKK